MHRLVLCAPWIVLLAVLLGVVSAEAAPLRVGTKPASPFAYVDERGGWHGTTIELWEGVAEDLGVEYSFEERTLPGLLEGLEDGSLDVVAAALTVTADREAKLDFTHPYYTTGLAVVVRDESIPVWLRAAKMLLSTSFLALVATVGLLQLLVGTIVWRLERRANPDQFGHGDAWQGLAAGFWWSTVTMTTVGYGDKTPKTVAGRVVAQGWMLCSVVIISVFTATVASSLTIDQLSSQVRSATDLRNVRVAVAKQSTSEGYAENRDVDAMRTPTLAAALDALLAGEVDAVVHDAPLLEEAVRRREGLKLLDFRFQRQDYAFAVPTGSPLRESINRVLPERLRAQESR